MKIEKYLEKNTILQIDAIEGMNKIEPHSVELIFADPPYGHTKNIYDKIKFPTDILNYPVKDKDIEFYVDGLDYENQIFEIEDFVEFKKIHPSMAIHATEKPAALCDFIVKTYSNEGDTVLDFCCGSGSIPLAAKRNNRNYIGFDIGVCLNPKSPNFNVSWADITKKRLNEVQSSQLNFNDVFKADKGEQISLFAS